MGAFFSLVYGLVVYALLWLGWAVLLVSTFLIIGATGRILVGIWFEERDLIAQFGDRYRRYRSQVGMLLPGRRAQ